MLTRLRFKNFKRFGDADVELGQCVVFIGPNNSGKTTALQALALSGGAGYINGSPLARAYRNKQELSPHTDSADLVGLFCLRAAQSGGVSRLTSATAVHNVLREEYPAVLERLYRGYSFPRRGEEQPGEQPYTPYRVPVYSNTEGNVSARYVRTYVEAGEAAAGRPIPTLF